MKYFILFLGIAILFGYAFVQSGAWEVAHSMGDKEGVEVDKRRHTINWDKFFTYVKNTPNRIRGKTPSTSPDVVPNSAPAAATGAVPPASTKAPGIPAPPPSKVAAPSVPTKVVVPPISAKAPAPTPEGKKK